MPIEPAQEGPAEGGSRGHLAAAGAVLAGLAVVLGAFGSHGLEASLSAADLETFETGVRYQLAHGLALLAVGLGRPAPGFRLSGTLMLLGVVLFSGSLFLLATTPLPVGLVTPLGGVLMIAGWAVLAWSLWSPRPRG